jgi:hypothetical protein
VERCAWYSSIVTVYVFVFVLMVTFGPRLRLQRWIRWGLSGLGLLTLLCVLTRGAGG